MDRSGCASANSLHLNEDILISQATETTENNGPQEQLSADIVARVSEEYHFNGYLFSSYFTFDMDTMLFRLCYSYSVFILFSEGMVDYQHVLAVHADATRRKKRNLADIESESG